MQRRPVWLTSLLPLIIGGILVIAIWLVFRGVINNHSVSSGTGTAERPSVQEQPQNLPDQRPVVPKGMGISLDVPGAAVKEEQDLLIVTFNSGLFSKGTRLTPDARAKLTTLGKQLEEYVGQVTVSVVGHTDNNPVPPGSAYRDNLALGYARALAVVEHLVSAAGLPASMFVVSSPGEASSPFPNDTRENRSRNQTVVIKVLTSERIIR